MHVYATTTELASAVAEAIVQRAITAVERRGTFAVALAGGSTPRPVYQRLAAASKGRLDWRFVHVFLTDERWVPGVHPDSNQRLIRETLLDRIAIPPGNVHAVPTDAADPEAGARGYHADIARFMESRDDGHRGGMDVTFDLVLLGVGEDGHTASLFPGRTGGERNDALAAAVAQTPASAPHARVTLTPRAINGAREAFFVVSGERKRAIVRRCLAIGGTPDRAGLELPAAAVRPSRPPVWHVDAQAGPPAARVAGESGPLPFRGAG